MNITAHIARHLLQAHEGGNWTGVDITGTLKDVSVQEAVALTSASPNTIAGLLYHISFWNRAIVHRIRGAKPDIPEDNGFLHPPLHTEEDWQRLKEDNIASAHELAAAMGRIDEDRLDSPILPGHSSVYNNLQGSVEHVHYHLGQMALLKKLLRNR